MNRQVQATLRSGLIFPGAGQLFLGRRWRALGFAVPVLAAVLVLLGDVVGAARGVADRLMQDALDGRTPDIGHLLDQVHQVSLGLAATSSLAVYVLVGLWAASIVDAWLLAR